MKTRNLTQISLRNDPINCQMHGFSFRIFEDKIEVQDVISPKSLDQTLISSILWMRKCIKNTKKSIGTWIDVWIVRISQRFKGNSFRREKLVFKGRIWAWPSDEGAHRDQRSWWSVLSRIVVFNWWSSDRRWRLQMRPCHKEKKMRRFVSLVRSSSIGHD